MKKKKRIALALAAALMMVLLLAACSDKTIRLGVAGIGGVYQVFGEDYAALQAQNGGRKLEVRETAGSAASLRLLSSGYLQMAVGRLSRVNAQKSKNIFYEARMRAISSRKSCSEHR